MDDPEVRYNSDTQQANATFKLMVHRGKDKNGENKGADFPRFKAFGKTAGGKPCPQGAGDGGIGKKGLLSAAKDAGVSAL